LYDSIYKLRVARGNAEDYVLRAKEIGDVQKRQQAQKLYETTRVKYNAYIDTLLDSIRNRAQPDLTPSATDASGAATTFENFVEENSRTKSPTAVLTAVKLILTAGLDIRDQLAKKKIAEAKAFADELEPKLKWDAWDKIKE
jgi:hypothetical protein